MGTIEENVKEPDKSGEKKEAAAAAHNDEGRSGKKKFEIDIFRGWCKCCGICAAFCPRECIRLDADGSPLVSDEDRCTGCGWCELHCPDFAISIHEKNSEKARHEEG